MDQREIVEQIAKNHIVEDIINKVGANCKENPTDLQDLIQDTYIDLLTKPYEKIAPLRDLKVARFYIARLVVNSICSKTSRYYYIYKKKSKVIHRIK